MAYKVKSVLPDQTGNANKFLKTEADLQGGFISLLYLSTISKEFKQQIKQVQKWQKKKQSLLALRLAELKGQ